MPQKEKITSLRLVINKNLAHYFVLCNYEFLTLMAIGDFSEKKYKKISSGMMKSFYVFLLIYLLKLEFSLL